MKTSNLLVSVFLSLPLASADFLGGGLVVTAEDALPESAVAAFEGGGGFTATEAGTGVSSPAATSGVDGDANGGGELDNNLGGEVSPPGEGGKALAPLIATLLELVPMLESENPALLGRLSESHPAIINAVLAEVCRGLRYQPPGGKISPPAPPEAEAKRDYPVVTLAGNQVLYVRLDTLAEDSLRQLAGDFEMVSRYARPPGGMVLDLRSCSGFAELPLEEFVRVLAGQSAGTEALDLPMVVLIGGQTSGSAEVLAASLAGIGRRITMGEPSAGVPFPSEPRLLPSGGILWMPIIPADMAELPFSPLRPLSAGRAYPQIEYEVLTGAAGAESEDTALALAVDLMVSTQKLGFARKMGADDFDEGQ